MEQAGLSRRALLAASGLWFTALATRRAKAVESEAAGPGTAAPPVTGQAPSGASAQADAAGEIVIGGDLRVRRIGFGAMRVTGDGIWGPPDDPAVLLEVTARLDWVGSFAPRSLVRTLRISRPGANP